MKALINLLSAYYNQDVWEDHETHEEVWHEYISDNPHLKDSLKTNLEAALKLDANELHIFIQSNSSGLSFDTSQDSRNFLSDLLNYLNN